MTTATVDRVAITGNTYPVKDHLKAIGGRWDPDRKVWMVPADRAEEARQIVAGAPKGYDRPPMCAVCGYREEGVDRRGYLIGEKILESGECQSCYEERRYDRPGRHR